MTTGFVHLLPNTMSKRQFHYVCTRKGRRLVAKDLRTFINQIAQERPDELVMVEREVDPVFELTGVVEKLEKSHQYPGVLFTNVKGSKLPVFINSMASYRRLAMSLGFTLEEAIREYSIREANPLPLKEVDSAQAPVHEVILTGDDVDLGLLPFTHHNEHDAGKYISAGISLVKDRESGKINAGMYRLQIQSKNEMGFMVNPINHANYVRIDYEEHNEEMPVAVVIGHHPAVYMASVSKVFGIGGELEVAGGLMGEQLEVVKAKTIDMLVPARAEIIIEGVIKPGKRRFEGPFGEWPRYYAKEGEQPVIDVTAITMRRDAICQDLLNAHAEHHLLGALPRMGSIYRQVKGVVPHLKAVNLPLSGTGRVFCYISIKKRSEGEPKQAAFAALTTEPNIKHVIVVDDDIDVFDENEVQWAVATRFEADRDLIIMPNCMGGHLNPTSYAYERMEKGPMQTKLIMDATKPLPPVKFPVVAKVPEEVVNSIKLDEYIKPFNSAALEVAAGQNEE